MSSQETGRREGRNQTAWRYMNRNFKAERRKKGKDRPEAA